jgi:mono/diheme cytochrome c family protein
LLGACYSLAEDITPPPGYVYETPRPTQAPTEVMYFPLMPPNPQAGQAIFAEKCSPCHGVAGLGDGPEAIDLPNPVAAIGDPDLARQRTPEEWFRIVTNGNIDRYMPPFLSLTERERWDVVAYAFTLSVDEAALVRGEEVYQENCAKCHGQTGLGDGAQAASLSQPPGNFRDQAIMAERSLDDLLAGMAHPQITEMSDFESQLSLNDRQAIAQYLRSLTFKAVVDEGESQTADLEETLPETEEQPAPAEVSGDPLMGILAGQVVNASGGELPEALEVTLYGFDQFQQVMTQTTTIGPAGTFTFVDVEMPEGRAFLAAVDFESSTYTSDVAVAGPDGGELFLPVSVFETSTDTSQLRIDRLHIFLDFVSPDVLRVAELVLISNPTSQVIVPAQDGQPVVEFSLPPGASNLQFQEGTVGSQFVIRGAGFGDLRSISPGIAEHQILFSFDMPYSRQLDLQQEIDLPVGAMVVLVPDVGVSLEGDFFLSEGVQEVEGQPYELYSGGSLPAGSVLPLQLSGRPNAGASDLVVFGGGDGMLIGLASLGGVLLAVGGWLIVRQRRMAWQPDSGEGNEPVPQHIADMDVDGLLDAIIALDDRFKAGDLPESAYLKRRKLLKNHLREVLEV